MALPAEFMPETGLMSVLDMLSLFLSYQSLSAILDEVGSVMSTKRDAQTVTANSRCRQRFASLQGDAAFALRECGVILAGFNEMYDPWEVRRAAPNFHVVFFSMEGEGWVRYRNCRYTARPGTCWVLPAGAPHEYGISKEPWKLFWFHLSDCELWKYLGSAEAEFCYQEIDQAPLRILLDGYLRESAIEHGNSQQAANAYAQLIAHSLRRLLVPPMQDPRSFSDDRIGRLWLDVQNDLKRDWRIQEMAARVHCSTSHFHRLVMKRHGVSPKKLLQKFRMERARELVAHPDYTLDSIADLVGYQSGFALSRAFKAWHGVAPAHYRNRSVDANKAPTASPLSG